MEKNKIRILTIISIILIALLVAVIVVVCVNKEKNKEEDNKEIIKEAYEIEIGIFDDEETEYNASNKISDKSIIDTIRNELNKGKEDLTKNNDDYNGPSFTECTSICFYFNDGSSAIVYGYNIDNSNEFIFLVDNNGERKVYSVNSSINLEEYLKNKFTENSNTKINEDSIFNLPRYYNLNGDETKTAMFFNYDYVAIGKENNVLAGKVKKESENSYICELYKRRNSFVGEEDTATAISGTIKVKVKFSSDNLNENEYGRIEIISIEDSLNELKDIKVGDIFIAQNSSGF